MGAINNAFNQALGATAGAALAIKHAKESDFSKMNTAEHSALVANNQASDAEKEAKTAALDEFQTTQDLAYAKTDKFFKEKEYYEARDENHKARDVHDKDRMKTTAGVLHKKLTELEASEIAITELNNKLNGIQTMRDRAKDQRAYADKASQIASKAQQKYQSRWGGK